MKREAYFHRLEQFASSVRSALLRTRGVTVGPKVYVGRGVRIRPGCFEGRWGSVELCLGVQLSDYTIIDCWGGRVTLGEHVFIGPHTVLYGQGGITVGDNSLIAMHCALVSAEHHIPSRDRCIRWEPDHRSQINIGRDVWIGAGVTIRAGISIGDGAVVGAGSVVTKDIEPHAVVAGVPAKVLRYRE